MKNINEAEKAYFKAINNGHTEELQEIACKDPEWAYYYARDVVGADIGYCQEMACKEPMFAYWFARDVKMADLEVCLEAVSGTEWEGDVRELIVKKVIG